MDLLKGLNQAQKEAVITTEGPVMVMAGAGSGKTRVLTTRISYIIKELAVYPSQILAVTFTNKAANEMKKRIASMLDMDTKWMWISTFHSFCSRLLRMEIEALPPYNKQFVIIDEEDSLKIVKDLMKQCDFDDKPKEIHNLISKSKNFPGFTCRDPHQNNVFTIILGKYEAYLKANNLLDFDDLIIKTIELFRKNPDILAKYQEKFQYIMVDEFQDTNTLQYDLMMMLAGAHHNLFVVGDDFQSIYSFRGAKIENIQKMRKDFKDTKLILLEENYRSTTEILNLANDIIKHNPNQIKKVMFTERKDGKKPLYYHATSSYDETMFVVNKIEEGVHKGRPYSDFAVMYRANSISRNFEDQLVKARIPYTIYGGISFFARAEIKDMTAYLRVLVNPMDEFSLRRIINVPKRKIGEAVLNKLSDTANERKCSMYEAIPFIPGKGVAVDNLQVFKKCMDDLREEIPTTHLKDLLKDILDKTGYEEELKKDPDTYDDRMDNIKEFGSVLEENEEALEGLPYQAMLESVLSDLSLRSENDEAQDDNSVRLTTFHQAKGLEFKTVFMAAMEEGIFPSGLVSEAEIEEERRICYVGITRAMDELYLTSADSRMRYGQTEGMMPSRFLTEMDKNLYDVFGKGKTTVINKPSVKKAVFTIEKKEEPKVSVRDEEALFKIGDKISHKVFGDGLVVAAKGNMITVAFKAPYGIKMLNGNHPSIRKL